MDCPIHLGAITLETDAAAALRCGHVFCFSCINTWFESTRLKAKCPVCNEPARRVDLLRLYGNPSIGGSSPRRSRSENRSAAARKRLVPFLQDLECLGTEGAPKYVETTSVDVASVVDGVAATDRGLEHLGGEIKSVMNRLHSQLLPELESHRVQLEALKEENVALSFSLQQKAEQIDATNRKNNALKQKAANLQTAKNIADSNCCGLRQTLQIIEGKLIDAESAIRAKDVTIVEKEKQLVEYRRWLAQNKAKLETQKAMVKELESRLDKEFQHCNSASRQRQEETRDIGSSVQKSLFETEEEAKEHSAKRRRTEETLGGVKLDTTCFVRQAKASFQIPKKEPGAQKCGPVGLNITNGQVKGVVGVGSRVRLAKMK